MASRAAKIAAYVNQRLRFWSRRYLRDPIILTDDAGKLKNIVSKNSLLVRWSAWAIVGGLFAEVLILLWFSRDKSWLETGLLIISNLIIAAGVFGEDRFGHVVGNAASRIQQISDEKIAEANARAEEANASAKEAELKLEQLRKRVGPRDIPHDTFLEALKDQPKEPVEILFVKDDPDSFWLANQIFWLLIEAKWNARPGRPIQQNEGIVPGFGPSAMSVRGQPAGVSVVAHSIPAHDARTAFNALTAAFLKSLGQAGGGADDSLMPDTLRIVVAPRP